MAICYRGEAPSSTEGPQGPKVVLQAGAGGGSRKRRAKNEDSEMKKRDEDETGEEFAESLLCKRHFACVFFLYQLY